MPTLPERPRTDVPRPPRLLTAALLVALAVVGSGLADSASVSAAPVSGPRGAATASAPAAPAASADDPVVRTSDAEAAETAAFWTPERRRQADADSLGSASDGGDTTIRPDINGGYEPVYWIGRLYFTRAGHLLSCTASSIASDSRSMIATAAHCLFTAGDYSTHLEFIPAWDGAERPVGTWIGDSYQVSRAWRTTEDAQHDAAFVKMRPQSVGGKDIRLADRAGAPRPDFGLATWGLHYTAFGYKNLRGRDVDPLITCSGIGRRSQFEARLIGIVPCAVVSGGSGGPVYHDSEKGPGGTQVGVVSTEVRAGDERGIYFVPWGDVEYSLFKTVDAGP